MPLLALHLTPHREGDSGGVRIARHEGTAYGFPRPSLVEALAFVWLYGAASVGVAGYYLGHAWLTKCRHEAPGSGCAPLFGVWGFALGGRVLPVLLVVLKVRGGALSWPTVFTPLWAAAGGVAMVGFCVSCLVPVLMLTQDAAGRVLGWIVAMSACFMVVPAVCTLVFLVLLCQRLTPSARPNPSLAEVVAPLFVMFAALAVLTPLLVRIVSSTHSFLDEIDNPGGTSGAAGGAAPPPPGSPEFDAMQRRLKRPGLERTLATSGEPEMLFVRQTETLFKRVAADSAEFAEVVAARLAATVAAAAAAASTAAMDGEPQSSLAAREPTPGAAEVAVEAATVALEAALSATGAPELPREESSPAEAAAGAAKPSADVSPPTAAAESPFSAEGSSMDSAALARLSGGAAATPLGAADLKATAETTRGAAVEAGPLSPQKPQSELPAPVLPFPAGGSEACYVCCERRRDSVLMPCGHGGLCYACAVEFVSNPSPQPSGIGTRPLSDGSLPQCPLCRSPVREVLRLAGVVAVPEKHDHFVAAAAWTLLDMRAQLRRFSEDPDGDASGEDGESRELRGSFDYLAPRLSDDGDDENPDTAAEEAAAEEAAAGIAVTAVGWLSSSEQLAEDLRPRRSGEQQAGLTGPGAGDIEMG